MTNPGSKGWARKLVAEYESGRPPKPTNVYRVAYQALGLMFPEGEQPGTQQALPLPPSKPASAVPVPKSQPIRDAWWDSEPPAIDSN